MDVILKVIKGSKEGTKIPVKKDEFLIGRSPECNLCAGSTSISRKHCKIRVDGSHVTVEDLGSRNGTVLNGQKTTGAVELTSGDSLKVGVLEFLVTISTGINNKKKPQITSVAQAVERSAEKSSGSDIKDDDISRWLLESSGASVMPDTFSDTQTITMDDTKSHELKAAVEEMKIAAGSTVENEDASEESTGDTSTGDTSTDEKAGKKSGPGKLPPKSREPATKDSREAAAEALRSWNRRR